MMTCTHPCGQWAQWKVASPQKDKSGKIVGWKTVAILCGQHKTAMQKMADTSDPPVDLRFNFVGAVPDGSYTPQS